MSNLLSISDLLLVPIYLIAFFLWAKRVKNRNIDNYPYYQYFTWGLMVKIIGGLAFAWVYLFYYEGGDTVYYFLGSKSLFNLAFKDFGAFIRILFGDLSPEMGSMFDATTGYPIYFRDPLSFSVSRFNLPLYLLGFGSYLGNTLVFNLIIYLSIWRFYKLIVSLYPQNAKQFAIALLFLPSLLFWTSGILKDGFCFAAILQIFYNLYSVFISRKRMVINLISLLFWSYIAISIRPYSFYVAIGSGLIWVAFFYLKQIKGRLLRTVAFPFVILVTWSLGAVLLMQTGSKVGERYQSIDAMLETAQIIQDDLSQAYYGGNSFDIGKFEPTIPGILKKFPVAITAGIYRPFLWESRNPLMLISGIEGFVLLIITLLVVIKCRVITFFSKIYNDPFLLSSFVFVITFAFFVGLTTANFGALVRYRTPVLPFLLIILFEIRRQLIQRTDDQAS